MDIQAKFALYIEINKEIAVFRKKQSEQKKVLQKLSSLIYYSYIFFELVQTK